MASLEVGSIQQEGLAQVRYVRNGLIFLGSSIEFRCRRFIPRESFISSLKETVKEKAIKEAETLFQGIAPNMSQHTIAYS